MLTGHNNQPLLVSKNHEQPNHEPPARIGLWGWLGLYATGAVLLFLVLSHIWLVHYSTSEPVSLSRTVMALRSPVVRTIEICLLIFALIHSMTGLRRVMLDMEIFKRRGSRYLTWCLIGVSVVLLVWGLNI